MSAPNAPRRNAPGGPERPDPEELSLSALARGDVRAALTALMAAYGDDIHRHCSFVLGDAALADDVTQTVFVEAYRDLAGFARRSSLRTWLYGIARHRCLDALKARRRFARRFRLTHAPPDAPAAVSRADERIDVDDRTRAIERCLARLRPQARIAVLLRYREGMTYEEMSAICGSTPAALQVRVARAVAAIRRWLEEEDAL